MSLLALRRLPNLLTLARLALIPPFALSFGFGAYGLALALFVLAGLSDAVDGWLARRFDWTSRFGAIVDPIADKCLVLTALALLYWQGALPLWFLLLAVGRDLVIVAGAYAYHRRYGPYRLRPSGLSKANTGLLLALVSWQLLVLTGVNDRLGLASGLLVLTALTSVLSGVDYVRIWGTRYRQHRPD